ncbi:MAG: DMT family transporter [Anaerovoracaceae bacterium]
MKGYFFAIASAIMFASQVILGKFVLNEGMNSFELSFMQLGISGIVLIFILVITFLKEKKKSNVLKEDEGVRKEKSHSRAATSIEEERKIQRNPFYIKRRDVIWMTLVTIAGGVCGNIGLYYALDNCDAGIASMLLFMNPAFICLFFIISKIKPVSTINKLALVFVIIGGALVLNIFGGVQNWTIMGILAGIMSGAGVATMLVVIDLKMAQYRITTILFYDQIFAALTILALFPSILKTIPTLPAYILGFVVIISVVTTVLPNLLILTSIIHIGSERASVIATMELPLTIIMAYAFYGEKLNLAQLIGIALVVLAVIGLSLEGKKQQQKIEIINSVEKKREV